MVLPTVKLTGYGKDLEQIYFSVVDNHVSFEATDTIRNDRETLPETLQEIKETIEGTTYRTDTITFDNIDGCTKKEVLVLVDAFKQECRKYQSVTIEVV
jgi:hypothetical protein